MPRSNQAELHELREEVFARDLWRCVWPGCHNNFSDNPADWLQSDWQPPGLQLAHLQHRGMGGSVERNTPENCVTLCRYHHDIFDGRDGSSNTKRELALMLKTVAGI